MYELMISHSIHSLLYMLCFLIAVGCGGGKDPLDEHGLFVLLNLDPAGITFSNRLTYTDSLNPYTYKSFYNGGGVALGDLDNNGFLDLIFAGNLVQNKVYRNLGNWKFEDVSSSSGLAGTDSWTTGVTLADVNGDGLLDVYLCKSGPPEGTNRRNELRLNKGDGTFVNVAVTAGVDDFGFSVHAAFLDYDRDGDLDLYLLNNSIRSVGTYDMRPGARDIRDTAGGNVLYRNELVETGKLTFTDVSEEAGIYGSDIGFGLGVTVGDVNSDLWPDIYVSNDFFERDYLYINRGDGTFSEELTDLIPESSLGAMGADLADLTGDGLPEVFVTEMLPEGARRYKSKANFENYEKRSLAEKQGYHRQYSRNSLLLNENGAFAEIARSAGVAATDWSWGALAADLDNDGWRDLYVANGIYKDLLDQDYIHFVADPSNVRQLIAQGGEVIKELIDSMPSEAIANYAFRNVGEGTRFADSTEAWGLIQPSFSNGSAYGDLDNDGDLDLVINTVNQAPLIYKNRHRELRDSSNYLRIRLVDTISIANHAAWGSRVRVYADSSVFTAEVAPVRGFMSCVDPRLHIGLAAKASIDSIVVDWSSGGQTRLFDVQANQELVIRRAENGPAPVPPAAPSGKTAQWTPLAWAHQESAYDDFDRYPLLVEMISAEGPALALLNAPDQPRLAYFGGAKGQAGVLYERAASGWNELSSEVFTASAETEDVAACWVDVNGDGKADLVVAAGGDESPAESFQVRPRLYLNRGNNRFELAAERFQTLNGLASGTVVALDADLDGDQDLYFGTHFRLGQYGLPAPSVLMLNDGSGKFEPADVVLSGDLGSISLVRSAITADLDGDGQIELITAQDYGPVTVFAKAEDGAWLRRASSANGLWRSLATVDFDGSGERVIVAGNLGLNTRLRTSDSVSLTLHIGDFDENGSAEHIMTGLLGDEESVLSLMPEVAKRMPSLRKRYSRFQQYATADTYDIIDTSRSTTTLEATELRSALLRYSGTEHLDLQPLPEAAQRTCIRAILTRDYSEQQRPFIYVAGNYTRVKPEFGGQLGGYGAAFTDVPGGTLRYLPKLFPRLPGEVRGLGWLGNDVVAARNNATPLTFAYEQ